MAKVIVACQTISDEVNKLLEEMQVEYPIIWIESGLHNYPERLKKRLTDEITHLDNVDTVILAFGYCGNALLGLSSPKAHIVVPRVDDCISLLLGSVKRRLEFTRRTACYFLTRGWMVYENNIMREYERCVARYGEKRASRIMHTIMGHYRRLVLIDTGAFPLEQCVKESLAFAQKMGLEHEVVPGSLDYLKKLLWGPWDDDFIVLPPGKPLTLKDFRLDWKEVSGAEEVVRY
ncbi:Domain of unknown function DUF1638 [Moorella glycerini]|uniref:DUF1638 domain-containing protein n=1 Tax=Neomoorella stamsii TaxID=1266720 RepID=A0A9X7J1R2_9FIRM|nr:MULTISPECIES: DUF1638 domain-containing protein [Moorella]PRR71551.1 hypothetical protein MOST_23890 [Moorella stamsii]CEP66584.1 Domain of unknown function DUF1638 [Moorella glycerini]